MALIDDAAIQGVKIGMMGTFAGIEILSSGHCSSNLELLALLFTLTGNILGPLIFFLHGMRGVVSFCSTTQELDTKAGPEITKDMSGGIKRHHQRASILGCSSSLSW